MSKVNIHKSAGELAAATNELLTRIRDSKKAAQGYAGKLRTLEDSIRAREKREQAEAKAREEAAAREEQEQAARKAEEALARENEAREQAAREAAEKAAEEARAVKAAEEAREAEAAAAQKKAAEAAAAASAAESRPAANEAQGERRPMNRDGQAQGERRPFNRDGQAQGERRPFNRDGQAQGERRPFNRDGQAQGERRPFNRDGQAQGERRPFNRDGQAQGERRPFNRDGQAQGTRPAFNRGGQDKDAEPTRPGQQRRPGGTMSRAAASQRALERDLAPTLEKDRAASFDAKKTQQHKHDSDKDAAHKSKKALQREMAPGYGDDEVVRGRRTKRRQAEEAPIERKVIESAVITTERVAIKDLAEKIGKPVPAILKKLMELGTFANINMDIDFDLAELVAADFGVTLEQHLGKSAEETMLDDFDITEDEGELVTRPPVVTIMGHVDHGKTSLLDAIRNTHVTSGEAGGITQHIGAYTITVRDDRHITFLDTPGHEAFTAMRARGAQVTDVAILVVAADDGIMPQTVEAIHHIQDAKVPMIVAINKMDKPTADPDRIMQELTKYGIVAEDWGGDAVIAKVSALTGQGLDELLDMILLVADVQELTANPNARARGTVVEARMDNRGRGPVATVLVQNGTLHVGDYVVAGSFSGRVRAMNDDRGNRVDEAGPSIPVEVVGFSDVPDAGDTLYAVDDERLAKKVATERREKIKADKLRASAKVSLDDLFERISQENMKELRIIIKADVQGSAEAVKASMEKLSTEEVRINCIHSAVGAITESDVMLASSSNAVIIGFNIRPDANGRAAAERENVDVRTYRVIYQAIEDMEKAIRGMLDPTFKEVVHGHAEVRQTFRISNVGTVAGSYVTDGKIVRGDIVRLTRDSVVIHECKLQTLRRFKDDVKEVASGYECGITLEGFNDVMVGDIIEAYAMEEVKSE